MKMQRGTKILSSSAVCDGPCCLLWHVEKARDFLRISQNDIQTVTVFVSYSYFGAFQRVFSNISAVSTNLCRVTRAIKGFKPRRIQDCIFQSLNKGQRRTVMPSFKVNTFYSALEKFHLRLCQEKFGLNFPSIFTCRIERCGKGELRETTS